jgi:hypothetical protein
VASTSSSIRVRHRCYDVLSLRGRPPHGSIRRQRTYTGPKRPASDFPWSHPSICRIVLLTVGVAAGAEPVQGWRTTQSGIVSTLSRYNLSSPGYYRAESLSSVLDCSSSGSTSKGSSFWVA